MGLNALASLADRLDWFSERVGRRVMWLAALLVLVQFTVVVLRYAFGTSFIWLQESVIYVHATLFMLTMGYTFLHDGHVRVDVLSARWSARRRAVVELLGVMIAVLPFCALVVWASWSYVAVSWRMGEGPLFVGGLPFQPALKTLIPVMAVLLGLQGVSVACRAILVIAGRADAMFPGKAER